MKYIQLFILMALVSVSQAIIAVTLVTPDQIPAATAINLVRNGFGISGIITRYQSSRSSIMIDGDSYILRDKGSLTDADLTPGRKIKYNFEQSPSESIGRVTRIWIELKK